MSDLTEAQVSRLAQTANQGSIIRAWCQHPGYGLYKQALHDIITDKKNVWLRGSEEDAKLARIKAQGVQEAFDLLTQFMTKGDQANRMLQTSEEIVAEK